MSYHEAMIIVIAEFERNLFEECCELHLFCFLNGWEDVSLDLELMIILHCLILNVNSQDLLHLSRWSNEQLLEVISLPKINHILTS